jgi:metal-responsive CopG/Arc/MetJ family transcriptional regulator
MAAKKETKSVTLDTYLLRKADDTIEHDENFSSLSSVVTIALIQFFDRYELEKDEISCIDLLIKMIQTPEGKRAYDKVNPEKERHYHID